MLGNGHVRFGRRALEKDLLCRHLVSAPPHDADRMGAFLQKAGLIEDQHAAGAEVVDHLAAHQVTGRVGVPACRRQQPLHRPRAGMPGGLVG